VNFRIFDAGFMSDPAFVFYIIMKNKEFDDFANKERRISSMTLHRYKSECDSYINPTIIEERKLNVASMDVFSRLMMDRIIFLGVPIDDDVANIIQAQLLFLASTDSNADISLYLNTPGGQVSSGLGIYDTMQLVEPDVATICTGMAASMGSVLLCAGAKGKRSALPHSRVLIHQPLGGAQGQASDIMIAAKEIEKTRQELCRIISDHSGQPYEKVFSDADRDYWMTAPEALEYGMVDEILSKKKKTKK
jgi:ATP-dependent Clp protease protease subunit